MSRTNCHEQADDREERAHFRNLVHTGDQARFFETTLAIVIGTAPALIHVDVVVGVGAGEEGGRDIDVNIAAATAGVLIIIEHRIVAQIEAEFPSEPLKIPFASVDVLVCSDEEVNTLKASNEMVDLLLPGSLMSTWNPK